MPRVHYVVGLLSTLILSLTPAAHAEEPPFPRPANRAEVRASFDMDPGADTLLRQNGFVVLDDPSRASLHQAYPGERKEDLPLLVTTDAMLALWYELTRSIVSETEQRKLSPQLSRAVASLHHTAERLRSQAATPSARQGLREAIISLAVADQLFGGMQPVAADLRGEIEGLRAQVLAARDVSNFPGEDFTQYRVRGHYTQSPALSRYFRGSMWLSRRFLPVASQPGAGRDAALREAVALAAILREDAPARTLLRSLVATRQYLAGSPNSISAELAIQALERVHGPRWSLAAAVEPEALQRLRRELGKADYPETRVWTRPTAPGTRFPRKVIALLPDAAIPDSRLFQATMHPSIPNRTLPNTLEVGAGLGLEAARRELRSSDPRASEVLAQIDRVGPLYKAEEGTLYGGWLAVLRSLQRPDRRAPRFMQGGAWQYKTLNTTLASWTQLRHTALLYTAQAYGGGVGLTFTPPEALVEPTPTFYRALGGLARRTRVSLAEGLSPRSGVYLRSFETKCTEFARLADAELAEQLTPEQAHTISEFGHWLDTFQFLTEPVVVDVATGSTGEVLHAATGNFHPLLAIPDPRNGLVYHGWVMSFYESRRQGYARLTDAEWKTTLGSQYLRPERPAWTEHFVARAGGAAFQAREPLRKAEALLLAQRSADALSLLRSVVQQQRQTPLATEAQLRIGQYYLDQHDYQRAAVELRACERLYGCTAARVARGLLETAEEGLSPQPTARDQKTAGQRDQIARLMAELRAARKGPANRGLEERLARVLLQESKTLPLQVTARLLQEAARLCRQEDLRWVLRYAALNPLAELASYGMKEDEAIDACLAFSRSDAPRPLRAGAVALAAQAGLGARDPALALQLLRPFRRSDVFRPHPTLSWLRSLPQQSFALPLDPEPLMARVAQNLVSPACTQTFQQGDWKHFAALQADLLPDDRTSRDVRLLFAAFSEQPNAPLRLFVEANGQERRSGARAAAAAFTALSRQYSAAKIAPYALWRAQGCAERAKDPVYGARLRVELTARFPNSYPATAARVREAVEQWAPETVLPLAPRVLAEGARLRDLELYLHLPTPASLQSELDRVTKAVQQVSPLLEPGQKPVLIRQLQTIRNQAALKQQVAKLFPKQQPEVYLRLMELDFLSSLAEPFLRRYPDHPEAKKAWDRLYSGSLTQLLPWLTPLVERGSSYRWEQQARRLLERLVVRDGWSDENETAYLSWIREQAAQVREARPRSRTETVADLAVARSLLRAGRPEDALLLLRNLRTHLPDRDLLVIDRAELTRWATLEIATKQLPDWEPRWHAQVQLPKFSGAPGANELPSATPLAGGGHLIIPVSLGQELFGITALDEETGKVRWRTPTSFPTSLAQDGEGRIYVGTARGTVVGVAATDGRILFERKIDPKAEGSTKVTLAADVLLAWSAGKLFGLAAATGEPLWSVEVDLLRGRPPVLGGTAFLAAGTGTVIAIDVRSGRRVWTRDYSKPKTEFSLVSEQPSLGEGVLGVRVGDKIELLDPADGHTRHSIQNDPEQNEYLTGVSDADFTLVLPGHVSGTFIQGRAGILSARDAPDGVLDRSVVYGNDHEGRITVTDMASNARLRGSNQPDSTFRWAAFAQHAYFITNSGAVSAFPRVEAPPVDR